MKNIIWQTPTGDIAITYITLDYIDPSEHADTLKQNKDVPSDWEVVAVNAEFPNDTYWSPSTYTFDGGMLTISIDLAKEETKNRLRQEREPLLKELDIQFQRNLETGADNTSIVAEKNRLRDITGVVDGCATLEELKGIKL